MPTQQQPDDPQTFGALLMHHGFAHETATLLEHKPILKKGDTKEVGRKRLMALFDNYYLQFIALQLERYGFNLNRAFIPASELSHAAGIIEGKHGNPTLDVPHLIALITEMVDAIMDRQETGLMTWEEFYDFSFIASDGSLIRGQDIIKALIKSNQMHLGSAIENYHHNFRGRIFSTLSMLQVVEMQLQELSPKGLGFVNRYGQPVSRHTIAEAVKHLNTARTLEDPKFADYLSLNAHGRLKASLADIYKNLMQSEPNLLGLETQRQSLERDSFNLGIYTKAWREYLFAANDYIRRLATPYA